MTETKWAARRQFLKTAGAASALLALDAMVPAWARGMQVLRAEAGADTDEPLVIDLAIREQRMAIAGGSGNAMTTNDTVPGPLLEWYEGRDVVLNVANHMRKPASIHWHGILLPFEMDGVPGVAFPDIEPGSAFQYRFPVKQSGTYWYHSHSGLQEQSGFYRPLAVHLKAPDPVRYDRDYVVTICRH